MAVYAIGDIQGCDQALDQLLAKIKFNQARDTLWFCGDLVNRGPRSLDVLRFVHGLGDAARIVLGNHDLHLLAVWSGSTLARQNDHLDAVLHAPDCDQLMNWLRQQPLIHVDHGFRFVLFHAALHPDWTLELAVHCAREVQAVLSGQDYKAFFDLMYGDTPDRWSDSLDGIDRLRCITNIFTRLRYFNADGTFALQEKYYPAGALLQPWFQIRPAAYLTKGYGYIFGHWSTLPVSQYGQVFAIDGGCLWGGELVALQLDTDEPVWHSVTCEQSLAPRSASSVK